MSVKIPKVVVDYVVVAKPENHWQVPMAEQYNPSLCGEIKIPISEVAPLPMNERKVLCRRCAMELVPDAVINLGIGIPPGVGVVCAEESLSDNLTMTVEPGVIGGVALGGLYFGCAINPEAMLAHPNMFDFYDGGGLDLAVLGMAEMDRFGNVNVSKFGPRIAGSGGFVDITQSTPTVVFCGTFTASGLKVEISDGELKVVKEGKVKKLVNKVEHITFSGEYGRTSGQKILYVTERAVFELKPEGVTLIEIAPGVDLEKDILNQMEFTPHISADLKKMDPRIFSEKIPMGIKPEIMAKNGNGAQPRAVAVK